MAAQELRKILRESGARQHHVASGLVRLLFQIALYVREEAYDRGSFFQLAF